MQQPWHRRTALLRGHGSLFGLRRHGPRNETSPAKSGNQRQGERLARACLEPVPGIHVLLTASAVVAVPPSFVDGRAELAMTEKRAWRKDEAKA
ncbi:MAG: hypothetical protein EA405_13940 [Rhodospirillales bacterium]|nr:MAG: hypothetical protein EA405_13940 [Rhodospirillales bacterium]